MTMLKKDSCAKIVEVWATGEVEGNAYEYSTNQIYIGKEITVWIINI